MARRLVREPLSDAGAEHVMDDAMLVMSELATNAGSSRNDRSPWSSIKSVQRSLI